MVKKQNADPEVSPGIDSDVDNGDVLHQALSRFFQKKQCAYLLATKVYTNFLHAYSSSHKSLIQ